jgi:hypothetical protein
VAGLELLTLNLEKMTIKNQESTNQPLLIASVVRSYFKNCGGCGKITTSDRWIEKTERNLKDHYRPICKKCAIWAELPVY